jgi:hypothetical protein
MLVVETGVHFLQRWSIRAIARELKLSRNSVLKAVRSGETSFAYERGVQPRPKLGPWIEALERLLAENDAQPARERPRGGPPGAAGRCW